ncbi:unnamed protein product [[Candida] boidinii]|nr:unnamed protein product [[Candida] boidinii]
MGVILYAIIIAMELGIFMSQAIWWFRFRWRKNIVSDDEEEEIQNTTDGEDTTNDIEIESNTSGKNPVFTKTEKKGEDDEKEGINSKYEKSAVDIETHDVEENTNCSPEQIKRDQQIGLKAIRNFLESKNSFDVLPVSYRLIVFETSLLVKRALNILLQNSIVSAPLWNSKTSRFAGLLTSKDFINVIQYYAQHPDEFNFVDNLTLDGLRDVEKIIGTTPLETVSIHPFKSLYQACVKMIESSARRIPLIDEDEKTHREIVVSVLTQIEYRYNFEFIVC